MKDKARLVARVIYNRHTDAVANFDKHNDFAALEKAVSWLSREKGIEVGRCVEIMTVAAYAMCGVPNYSMSALISTNISEEVAGYLKLFIRDEEINVALQDLETQNG